MTPTPVPTDDPFDLPFGVPIDDPVPARPATEDDAWRMLTADDPAEPTSPCRWCGSGLAGWQRRCPDCGEADRQAKPKAIPVAPPPVAVPVAIPVYPSDPDDGIPVGILIADVVRSPRRRRMRRPPPRPTRLAPMFAGYAILLGMLVLAGIFQVVMLLGGMAESEEDLLPVLLAFDVVCTGLVGLVAWWVGRLPAHPTTTEARVGAWAGGLPVLGVLLALNIGFTLFLRHLLGVEAEPGPGLTLMMLLVMCLQPAVVEEWFFRHLALGTLREAAGLHGAVWLSGVMFGFAHLLNPVAIPYLCLVGVCLGYLRVWSGSLLLPMILHFLHNAVVLYVSDIV